MTNITPPQELISQWLDEFYDPAAPSGIAPGEATTYVATHAAQWGADHELDECCKWLPKLPPWSADDLRRHRRPKPLSLKVRIAEAIAKGDKHDALSLLDEALPNDSL